MVIIYPLIILYLNQKDLDKLKSEKYTARAGVVYENLSLKNGKLTLIWPLFLNLEKLILAYMLVFVFKYQFAQLFAVNFLCVTRLIISGLIEPYKDIKTNRKELIDNASIFLNFYHLFCATDFVLDAYTKSLVGWSMIMITSVTIATNLFYILFTSFK